MLLPTDDLCTHDLCAFRCLSMFTPRPAAWLRVPERTLLVRPPAPAPQPDQLGCTAATQLAESKPSEATSDSAQLQVSWPQWVNQRGAAIGTGLPGSEGPTARCYGLGAAMIESAVAHASGVLNPSPDCRVDWYEEVCTVVTIVFSEEYRCFWILRPYKCILFKCTKMSSKAIQILHSYAGISSCS